MRDGQNTSTNTNEPQTSCGLPLRADITIMMASWLNYRDWMWESTVGQQKSPRHLLRKTNMRREIFEMRGESDIRAASPSQSESVVAGERVGTCLGFFKFKFTRFPTWILTFTVPPMLNRCNQNTRGVVLLAPRYVCSSSNINPSDRRPINIATDI